MNEALGMEKFGVKTLGLKDANDTGITGARFDMQKFKRVTILVSAVAGTTTTAHTFSLKQHKVASAGTPSALAIGNPYFHKIDSATKFTKVVPTAKADSYDLHALLGDAAYTLAFEILAEDLAEGERYISIDLTDTGTAQVTHIQAIGHHAEYAPVYGQEL